MKCRSNPGRYLLEASARESGYNADGTVKGLILADLFPDPQEWRRASRKLERAKVLAAEKQVARLRKAGAQVDPALLRLSEKRKNKGPGVRPKQVAPEPIEKLGDLIVPKDRLITERFVDRPKPHGPRPKGYVAIGKR
jgi:hypothetical protein